MTRKVLKVGNSAGITIPKKYLEEAGLKIGDQVRLDIDESSGAVTIKLRKPLSKRDAHIARLTWNFINRYRADLEVLAKK